MRVSSLVLALANLSLYVCHILRYFAKCERARTNGRGEDKPGKLSYIQLLHTLEIL